MHLNTTLVHYRWWLPTNLDAFFNFCFLVLYCRKYKQQKFQNKAGLTIPVNQHTSERKEGSSHHLFRSTLNLNFRINVKFANCHFHFHSNWMSKCKQTNLQTNRKPWRDAQTNKSLIIIWVKQAMIKFQVMADERFLRN